MSTAEHPDALTRRIEQLAAASSDEPENEGAAVAALVGGSRSQLLDPAGQRVGVIGGAHDSTPSLEVSAA